MPCDVTLAPTKSRPSCSRTWHSVTLGASDSGEAAIAASNRYAAVQPNGFRARIARAPFKHAICSPAAAPLVRPHSYHVSTCRNLLLNEST
jgi:hypothetical protein